MSSLKALLALGTAQVLLVTPAWAHPSIGPHVHIDELIPVVALAAVLATVLLLRRSRPRAR